MSSRSLRGSRQRKMLQLDLNMVPPLEDNSVQIDIDPNQDDTDDDDVVELSPTTFAQTRSNQKRKIHRRSIYDIDDETGELPKEIVIDGKVYRTVETGSSSTEENEKKTAEPPEPPKKPPALDCPICMAAFEEPMSTRCGHIFCRGCINPAIAAQGKCPTCRKKVTKNQLIRVFLPSLS
ncbi:E3 ubiquitin-protein ligase RNF4-like [Vigna radiata var. radiata]|uniref:E3 ubiquitin-protein ligase RNF4-like n=1 Tax=Vigna radiata var. radiata TaxID=3916 RepID=A0A1S3TAU3_VIGRR|nr:E3 ubiquitin-protein ligase RNF4-like [Vigna radiata var. radiata]